MIDKDNVEKMVNSRDKQLMLILAEKGKPYIKKFDGYAVKMEEEKQIVYTDKDNRENTFTIPEGSYIMVGEDSSCPHIVTEKEWADSNKFVEDEEKPSSDKGSKKKIGLESL
jgi:hypothetical protein